LAAFQRGERNSRIIDGVRALGILLVIFFHVVMAAVFTMAKNDSPDGIDQLVAASPAVLNITCQALGSEVVFMASGFLLSFLLFREHVQRGTVDIRRFLLRRASRILPLYAIGLLLFVFTRRFELRDYVFNLLFVSKIADARTIIPVGWSLELMIQFFVVLPFLVLFVVRTRRPLLVLSLLVLASVAVRFVGLAANPEVYRLPIYLLMYGIKPLAAQEDFYQLIWYRATPFLMGLLLAFLVVHRSVLLSRWFDSGWRAGASLVVGVVLIASMGFLPAHDRFSFLYDMDKEVWLWIWGGHRFLFIVGVALVVLAGCYARSGAARWAGDGLAWRGFATPSRNIYSIYMFHLAGIIPAAALVGWTIDRHSVRSVNPVQIVLIFVIAAYLSIQLSKVIMRWVEMPAQAWLRAKWLRPRSGPAA
jgi:peptidoglycan/LPS O-acetylase OafA/YrhL